MIFYCINLCVKHIQDDILLPDLSDTHSPEEKDDELSAEIVSNDIEIDSNENQMEKRLAEFVSINFTKYIYIYYIFVDRLSNLRRNITDKLNSKRTKQTNKINSQFVQSNFKIADKVLTRRGGNSRDKQWYPKHSCVIISEISQDGRIVTLVNESFEEVHRAKVSEIRHSTLTSLVYQGLFLLAQQDKKL